MTFWCRIFGHKWAEVRFSQERYQISYVIGHICDRCGMRVMDP